MSESKERKFLKPLSVAVATVVAATVTNAGAEEAKATVEKGIDHSAEQQVQQVQQNDQLILQAVDADGNKMSMHGSHYSHGSHGSHSSHSSHSSSRW